MRRANSSGRIVVDAIHCVVVVLLALAVYRVQGGAGKVPWFWLPPRSLTPGIVRINAYSCVRSWACVPARCSSRFRQPRHPCVCKHSRTRPHFDGFGDLTDVELEIHLDCGCDVQRDVCLDFLNPGARCADFIVARQQRKYTGKLPLVLVRADRTRPVSTLDCHGCADDRRLLRIRDVPQNRSIWWFGPTKPLSTTNRRTGSGARCTFLCSLETPRKYNTPGGLRRYNLLTSFSSVAVTPGIVRTRSG